MYYISVYLYPYPFLLNSNVFQGIAHVDRCAASWFRLQFYFALPKLVTVGNPVKTLRVPRNVDREIEGLAFDTQRERRDDEAWVRLI